MLAALSPKYVGKIWPTGKFGVSRQRETPNLLLCQSHRETHETQWNASAIAVHGAEAVLKYRNKWEEVMNPDLSNVTKSPIRAKRGTKGISRHGRNLISSAAVITERNHDRRLLTFGTVTLPSAPVGSLRLVSQNWSLVVKKFVKNLTRGLLARGLLPAVFGVTEIQMKRFEKTGVPALHLHFVFVGRNSRTSAWAVHRKDIRRWWRQAIAPYLPSDTDYSSVENVQAIRKSVSAYLGKYMSKGVGAIAQLIDRGLADWIPSAWFTISHDLRREVLSNVLSGSDVGEFLNWLCHNVMQSWVKWVQPVFIEKSDGTRYSIGFAGTLTRVGLDKAAVLAL